jgi:malonate-semialdehyde dehydrogenase (acetylating)/methylmalonate-semialdehyde dehydrogenase
MLDIANAVYAIKDSRLEIDPISGVRPIKVKYHAGGAWLESKTERFQPCYNPSTGALISFTPLCTADEVDRTIRAAAAAYPGWSNTPVTKRVQVLFRMKALIDKHLDELTYLCAFEEGKKWDEAMGDILKVAEVIEYACGVPHLMKGEALLDVSSGYDTTRYNHPIGVFAGISPWNFPAMIPHGWMAPLCIATGNTMVLKPATFVPQSCMRMLELWQEAGLPDGVLNAITADPPEAEIFLSHPDIKGVSFVGSTKVGAHIYATAAANGKRVQALTSAKNHALVLRDCKVERTAAGIINAFCGCAGERCMALPVVVVENAIADKLVVALKENAAKLTMGPAYDKATGLGPVVHANHQRSVLKWIETGIQEGAKLIVDGRKPKVSPGCEKGFFIGPTIFDHVTEDMSVGREEIFGPVLCIKRVDSFEQGLRIMNSSRYANGSVIYTQNGYYARTFAKETHAGMVGINVGIPVPVGIFGFTGHKQSFFGDLHVMGRDGLIFYTESKNVTGTWFAEDKQETAKVDTWDGTMAATRKTT